MKLLFLFLSALIFLACQTSQLSSKKQSDEEVFKHMLAEQEAVKQRVADDQKSDEQIFEEMLAADKAQQSALGDENVETYQCCAHWMADGTCAHELIPGCSQELDAADGAQTLFFEVKAPNSCCASWAADGQCLHEIVPGCAGN